MTPVLARYCYNYYAFSSAFLDLYTAEHQYYSELVTVNALLFFAIAFLMENIFQFVHVVTASEKEHISLSV